MLSFISMIDIIIKKEKNFVKRGTRIFENFRRCEVRGACGALRRGKQVGAPKVRWTVSETKTNFFVARSPSAALRAAPPVDVKRQHRRGGNCRRELGLEFLSRGNMVCPPTVLDFSRFYGRPSVAPTVGKVRIRNVRTNPVGGGAHDAPQVSLQCSHKPKKAPPSKGSRRDSARGIVKAESLQERKRR